ncbi:hypothetical protein K438DRAFT_1767316 [Mycena galopus ATCC 62051]|nr:hypothetical protein K438DRAFT_1767316 [Mycena galopus ATCC 62051]
MLQILTWGLFAAVERRGFIALPVSSANWVKKYGHPVTIIATLISTALAACSSYKYVVFFVTWSLGCESSSVQFLAANLRQFNISVTQCDSSVSVRIFSPTFHTEQHFEFGAAMYRGHCCIIAGRCNFRIVGSAYCYPITLDPPPFERAELESFPRRLSWCCCPGLGNR